MLPILHKLRSCSIAHRHHARYHDLPSNTADLLPLFYLPCVEYLSLFMDNVAEFTWPVASPPRPCKLSVLKLSKIRESMLPHILAVAPASKALPGLPDTAWTPTTTSAPQ